MVSCLIGFISVAMWLVSQSYIMCDDLAIDFLLSIVAKNINNKANLSETGVHPRDLLGWHDKPFVSQVFSIDAYQISNAATASL